MKFQITKYKLFVIWCLAFGILLFLLLTTNYLLPTVNAQPAPCSTPAGTTPPRAEGLVTSPNIDPTSKFYSTGKCIIDQRAAFLPLEIPTFDKLKSIYYDQAKSTASITKHLPLIGDKTQADIPIAAGSDHLWYVQKTTPASPDGNLNISSPYSCSTSAVIFVDGNLTFSPPMTQFTYGCAFSGIVFIVKGDINIDPSITQIAAVLISQRTIYTAGAGCSNPTPAAQLTISGSLVSLDPAKPIRFCRSLTDNTLAAEIINQQPKFLVIFRNIISQSIQKWSEVAQ